MRPSQLPALAASALAIACHSGVAGHTSSDPKAGNVVHEIRVPVPEEPPPSAVQATGSARILDCTDVPATDPSGSGYDCPASELVDCHRACLEGEARACAGLLTARSRGEAVDSEALGRQMEVLCDARTPIACRGLGQLYAAGDGLRQDNALAVGAFESACSGGDGFACVFLAYMLREGQGAPKDMPRAFELLTSTCRRGLASACNSLGYWYVRGNFVAQDHERAFELFLSACRQGELNACDSVGEAYEKGWHVAQDLRRAEVCYMLNCKYWNGGASCESADRVRALMGDVGEPSDED